MPNNGVGPETFGITQTMARQTVHFFLFFSLDNDKFEFVSGNQLASEKWLLILDVCITGHRKQMQSDKIQIVTL